MYSDTHSLLPKKSHALSFVLKPLASHDPKDRGL